MKRLLSLLALCCLVFVACSNDENVDNSLEPAVDKITLSNSVIEVGFEPDTYVVSVTSPYSWDAFSKSDWVEVVTKQGAAGVTELSFNVTTRNDKLEKRMGSIVVTNSEHNLVAELYIIQNKGGLDVGEYAVDLGLRVKWATCNVGATAPEEYGDYFAWGEISPKDSYAKNNCSTYGVPMTYISGNPQYDAATANWGGTWRMPTMSELQELCDNCTWEWTTLNGVNGYNVTGPNGNSIFLPAAGYRYGLSSDGVGSGCYYWSSMPRSDYGEHAYYLYSHSEGYGCTYDGCYYGLSVRPVLEIKSEAHSIYLTI